LSPYFAQGFEGKQINYDSNVYFLLCDFVIESQAEMLPIMEFAGKLRKPVVVVAPDFRADALTGMVVNHLQNKVRMCAVKTPMTDQKGPLSILHDLAAYTGATIVSKDLGMRLEHTAPAQVLGKASEVSITSSRCVILEPNPPKKVAERIHFL
jgi:chaperonin GroEL